MDLSKLFTYGVEVEGLFTPELLKTIKKKTKLQEKSDGSVQYSRIFDAIKRKDKEKINMHLTEINTGVFAKQEKMLDTLKLLKNDENYFCNNSCGLHLHIKPKSDYGYLRQYFEDYRLIKKLQNFGFNLCPCIKARKHNQYCRPYSTIEKTRKLFNLGDKYQFVRNHKELETYEFRFFATCEHKVENIKKFLDFLFKELEKGNSKKMTNIKLCDQEEMLLDFEMKIEGIFKKNIKDNLKIEPITRENPQENYNSFFRIITENN